MYSLADALTKRRRETRHAPNLVRQRQIRMADVRIGEGGNVASLDERLFLNEEIVARVIVAHEQLVLVAIDQHAVEGRGQIALQG